MPTLSDAMRPLCTTRANYCKQPLAIVCHATLWRLEPWLGVHEAAMPDAVVAPDPDESPDTAG
ncbi:conserved hypothetical protein [Streptomyces sviceus ATCC 29083]|uniref:Uncharacterized protein n=1 Tax=Streptomyces sviceus (strain ATCC 29083 / DSM 924 / JCM 4929 / NBRC 13980 / NCIMB 11184 / NRRL 5439 / UC 5370) TaxID=463191 RepID=B5HLS3_STRX2|nr:conserved hypothetical protein [Streptomyces sviceus ATCC 29083]